MSKGRVRHGVLVDLGHIFQMVVRIFNLATPFQQPLNLWSDPWVSFRCLVGGRQ